MKSSAQLLLRRAAGRPVLSNLLRSSLRQPVFLASTTTTKWTNHMPPGGRTALQALFSTSTSDSSKEKEEASTVKSSSPTKSSPKPSAVSGVALSAGTAAAGFSTAGLLSDALTVPISGIPVSTLLGMSIRNVVLPSLTPTTDGGDNKKLPNYLQPGITLSTKTILQTGIVCVAAKLSVLQVMTTTATCLPVVAASVGAGMLYIPWASSMVGSSVVSPQLGYLLTAGTSICGVTAITALAPAIQASNRDIAVAVANTVAFGTMGMLCYPYLFHYLCEAQSEQVGLCLGVAIHDTSQVLGAALSYKETFEDPTAFQVAAVTKLMRNLGLAVCIPVLTYSHAMSVANQTKKDEQQEQEKSDAPAASTIMGLNTFSKYVPPFLWAFLGVSALRSGGDVFLADVEMYKQAVDFVGNDMSKYCLGTAMAGVGLSTSASALRGVGWKPFLVGGSGALVVGGTGFAVASFIV